MGGVNVIDDGVLSITREIDEMLERQRKRAGGREEDDKECKTLLYPRAARRAKVVASTPHLHPTPCLMSQCPWRLCMIMVHVHHNSPSTTHHHLIIHTSTPYMDSTPHSCWICIMMVCRYTFISPMPCNPPYQARVWEHEEMHLVWQNIFFMKWQCKHLYHVLIYYLVFKSSKQSQKNPV